MIKQACSDNLLSDEHFTWVARRFEAWASVAMSVQAKEDVRCARCPHEQGHVDVHGEPRSNKTYASTAVDSRLADNDHGRRLIVQINRTLCGGL